MATIATPSADTLAHMELLRQVARSFLRPGRELAELVNMGWAGLLRACETFNPAKGIPFEAWATVDIKKEIIEALRGDRIVVVPPNKCSEVRNGIPDDVSPARRQTLAAAREALDARVVGDHSLEHGTLADLIVDRAGEAERPGVPMEDILPLVDGLAELQRQAIRMRCGLGDSPCLTFREIADQLGVSYKAAYSAFCRGLKSLERLAHPHADPPNEESSTVITSRSNGSYKTSTNGTANPPAPDSRRCPACNHSFKNQKTAKCYNRKCAAYRLGVNPKASKPTGQKGGHQEEAGPRLPAPTARVDPPSPALPSSSALLELGAMQQITATLSLLPAESAARVLAWAGSHFGV